MALCLLVGGWLSLAACHPPKPRMAEVGVGEVVVGMARAEDVVRGNSSFLTLSDPRLISPLRPPSVLSDRTREGHHFLDFLVR